MECELCGEDCFITGCLDKEHKMKYNFFNLQKLKQEHREVYKSIKDPNSFDTDEDYYQACDRLERLAYDIQMIEENIPQPPHPCRRVNILGHRLDSKERRVKLSNGKYAR